MRQRPWDPKALPVLPPHFTPFFFEGTKDPSVEISKANKICVEQDHVDSAQRERQHQTLKRGEPRSLVS